MIGERLAEIRKDYGDTQAVLAEKLNITLSAVRSWEQEKSSPSHDMLVSICQLYQVSSDYLLGLTNSDPVYRKHRYSESFSDTELAELKNYEAYLLWKQKKLKT